MSIGGRGGYNLSTKHITAQLAGKDLRLSKFDTLAKLDPSADGVLSFNATPDGTIQQPNLHAKVDLANVTVENKPLGQLTSTRTAPAPRSITTSPPICWRTQVAGSGQTSLLGDFDTQAKLTLTGLDVANAIALFAPGSVKATSNLAATINVSGPAAKPQQMAGNAQFDTFDLKLEGIELKSAEPIRLACATVRPRWMPCTSPGRTPTCAPPAACRSSATTTRSAATSSSTPTAASAWRSPTPLTPTSSPPARSPSRSPPTAASTSPDSPATSSSRTSTSPSKAFPTASAT
jgi:hypothetical protein